MIRASLNDPSYENMTPVQSDDSSGASGEGAAANHSRAALAPASRGPRRTPRTSLIVVLPEDHIVSPASLAERLPIATGCNVDVIVACAGQPINLHALKRIVNDAQFQLAPAGTSMEDLRELAMERAPGDIVTLLSGALQSQPARVELEIKTS